MKASELIKELQNVPGDTEINFEMDDGCCGEWMDLELNFVDAEVVDVKFETYTVCKIRFKAIDGFTSCIKSGSTKQFIKKMLEGNK
jgi:hypothetical protein